MKKFIVMLMTILLTTNMFAMETIATTYQTNLTPSDMVEIFVEKLNESAYAYQVADYKVYTAPDEQNYAWSVMIDTKGYRNNDGGRTHEKSVYLYMKNGYVCLKTFGGPTITNHKDCINANEEGSKVHNTLYDAIYSYIKESKTWLRRYNKNYRKDEIEALDMLSNISTLSHYYYINQDTFRREYYIIEKSVSYIQNLAKANNLSWSFLFFQDEELLDFCKRHNCSLYKVGEKDRKNPGSIKKSKLKKLKNEGHNIYVYYTCPYTLYKVQNDEVVSAQVYQQYYLSIDDMLLGDYQNFSCRFVDESNNVIYEYY